MKVWSQPRLHVKQKQEHACYSDVPPLNISHPTVKAELLVVILSKEPDSASDAEVLWSEFRSQLSGKSLT